VIRPNEQVFVDTGAWIALAVVRDPLHQRARQSWNDLSDNGARLSTSIPVIIETFTFLERNTERATALAWKDSLTTVAHFRILECRARDLTLSWKWFERTDLHKLSAVDASSFVIMRREKIRTVFAFDHHFASAGFRMIG
jgi:predicted nucleic acid-binding protein